MSRIAPRIVTLQLVFQFSAEYSRVSAIYAINTDPSPTVMVLWKENFPPKLETLETYSAISEHISSRLFQLNYPDTRFVLG